MHCAAVLLQLMATPYPPTVAVLICSVAKSAVAYSEYEVHMVHRKKSPPGYNVFINGPIFPFYIHDYHMR